MGAPAPDGTNGRLDLLFDEFRLGLLLLSPYFVDHAEEASSALASLFELPDRNHCRHGAPGALDDELVAFVVDLFEQLTEVLPGLESVDLSDHVASFDSRIVATISIISVLLFEEPTAAMAGALAIEDEARGPALAGGADRRARDRAAVAAGSEIELGAEDDAPGVEGGGVLAEASVDLAALGRLGLPVSTTRLSMPAPEAPVKSTAWTRE